MVPEKQLWHKSMCRQGYQQCELQDQKRKRL